MSPLTIATLCQVLANLTHNRCILAENSNTCRCFSEMVNPSKCVSGSFSSLSFSASVPTTVVSAAPEMMISEVVLIFFVLALWLSAIGFCLNQYKSLRRLETQVHYCVTRKDPLNIGEIKIVTREQDSIIYKKKRYSTLLDPQLSPERLKAMRYVQHYLPKTSLLKTLPNRSISKSSDSPSSLQKVLTTHDEVAEEQSTIDLTAARVHRLAPDLVLNIHRAGIARLPTGLTVPHISSPSSFRSNPSETSRSTQHLAVPISGLRSTRFSDGNISLPVPQRSLHPHEQLIDPQLIPESVRRSLLALHRESHDNVLMRRQGEKTQSENDVHGAFHPWKLKMQSKLKRTRQRTETLPPPPRPHLHTLASAPVVRRSLIDYPNFSTQSTSESEATQHD